MANSKQHALVGAGVALIGWVGYCKLRERPIKLEELFVVGAVGAFVGLLPDVLEPATNPHHRQFFHSITAAALVARANHWAWQNPQLPEGPRQALHLASAAFLSHLLLDAQTPMGVPLI